MQITTLTHHHADDAVRLWEASGLTRPWNDAHADFARAVHGPDSAVLGVVSEHQQSIGAGDKAIGGTLLATAMVGHDGHRGWVYYLAVTTTHRGAGFARDLMAACEEWIRERGIAKIQLMVRSDNAPVIGFYEHLGYEHSDVVVLGRRLQE